jgi:hypothetical protein
MLAFYYRIAATTRNFCWSNRKSRSKDHQRASTAASHVASIFGWGCVTICRKVSILSPSPKGNGPNHMKWKWTKPHEIVSCVHIDSTMMGLRRPLVATLFCQFEQT